MISRITGPGIVLSCLLLIPLCLAPRPLQAEDEVLGELQFAAASNIEKVAGVWVDGLYVGYVKELKGSKKVVLLPGRHEIVMREPGYKDSTQSIVVEPGQKQTIRVKMEKDPEVRFPSVTAEVKLFVNPKRAAVFVDDKFVGHVDEFDGSREALLLAPGKHQVKITLPGYQTFETEISLLANQKFELKTELPKGSILQAEPLVRERAAIVHE